MKRKSSKKLFLSRETVLLLENELAKVEGAGTGTCWCSDCNSSCDPATRHATLCDCTLTC
jgi:hypothetical protein